MGLGAIARTPERKPPRVLVMGTEGVGKSTFAAGAPSPVFLGPEDGTGRLDVSRFPLPESWQDVLDAIMALDAAHEHKTLVIDTLDWIEPLVWRHVCKGASVESIEDLGYGKGYVKALDEWRLFLSKLERLRARGITVVLLAHTHIKNFQNPEGDNYDRYELKLHTKAGGLLKEWCDAVMFANYETVLAQDKRTNRFRGFDTGARLLHTTRQAAYDAKNRYDLPPTIPLNWDDFAGAIEKRQSASPADLRAAIDEKRTKLPADVAAAAEASLARAGDDASKLAQLNDWINAKLAEVSQ